MQAAPASKPSKKYFVRAAPRGGSFTAQFGIPGITPDVVRLEGNPVTYGTAEEAELAAARVVMSMANDRLALRTKFEEAAALPAADLSAMLDEIHVTPTEIGHLFQTDYIMSWLGGERRVPHMANIILQLMQDPAIKKKVEAITAAAIVKGTQNANVS